MKTTVEDLREVAAADPVFHTFLHGLKTRQRDPFNRETKLDEICALGANRSKAVSLLRKLADAGYGSLIVGRRGQKTRFVWATSAKEAARELIAEPEEKRSEPPDVPGGDTHKHTYLLRPGLVVTLSLPLDLSPDESRRLADFVRSLPFLSSQNTTATAEG